MLAPHLDAAVAVYGLPALGLDSARAGLVERCAARMAESIRATQPQGPYRLAGWSFGGLLAYEIAAQLIGQQAVVECVVVLDAPTTLSGYLPPERIARPAAGEAATPLDYRARSIEARVHLLVARERIDAVQTLSTWSDVVPSGLLQTVLVDGNHHSMIRPPHIESVARHIGSALGVSLAAPDFSPVTS